MSEEEDPGFARRWAPAAASATDEVVSSGTSDGDTSDVGTIPEEAMGARTSITHLGPAVSLVSRGPPPSETPPQVRALPSGAAAGPRRGSWRGAPVGPPRRQGARAAPGAAAGRGPPGRPPDLPTGPTGDTGGLFIIEAPPLSPSKRDLNLLSQCLWVSLTSPPPIPS